MADRGYKNISRIDSKKKICTLGTCAFTTRVNRTLNTSTITNRAGKEVLPYTEQVAIVGVSSLRTQLVKATSLFNRSSFTLFVDEGKALDWLAQ